MLTPGIPRIGEALPWLTSEKDRQTWKSRGTAQETLSAISIRENKFNPRAPLLAPATSSADAPFPLYTVATGVRKLNYRKPELLSSFPLSPWKIKKNTHQTKLVASHFPNWASPRCIHPVFYLTNGCWGQSEKQYDTVRLCEAYISVRKILLASAIRITEKQRRNEDPMLQRKEVYFGGSIRMPSWR